MTFKCATLIAVLLFYTSIYCDRTVEETSNSESNFKRDSLETRAINAYRNACHRLQHFADWMTIVLRVKSMWTRSVSRNKQERILSDDTTSRLSPREPGISRQKIDHPSSCASLKNLHVSALTYVQWQAELMRVKALVGGNFLKNSMSRLNETAESLKILRDRVKNLDIVNRTSNEILQNLKLGVQGLSLQLQEERDRTQNLLKEIGLSKDFLPHLYSVKDDIMNQLEKLSETSEGLRRAEALLQQGDLLQVLGNALEKKVPLDSPSVSDGEEATETS